MYNNQKFISWLRAAFIEDDSMCDDQSFNLSIYPSMEDAKALYTYLPAVTAASDKTKHTHHDRSPRKTQDSHTASSTQGVS